MSERSRLSILAAPQSALRFFNEARQELRKVTWPTRETTAQYTLIVIVSSVAISLLIGGIDYLLSLGLRHLIN